METPTSIFVHICLNRLQPTYEEWKPLGSQRVTVPLRGLQPTYEEWKRKYANILTNGAFPFAAYL